MRIVQTLKNWNLTLKGRKVPAEVPGDVMIDAYKAGMIEDPYIRENYKDAAWIGREDFVYETLFDVSEEAFAKGSQTLVFKGIDLFADIYLNGVLLGSTKNAFLEYRFDAKASLKQKSNVLRVFMHSTLNEADKIDTAGYSATFNLPRIFLRKPQCHFGWDWAPKICAYGIIDDVTLESAETYQISDVHIKADDQGRLNFFVETNYSNNDLLAPDGSIIKKGAEKDDDRLVFEISKTPFKEDFFKAEIALSGKKNFYGTRLESFKKWWPTGYGEQPLYPYRVSLFRGGKKLDERKGYFAFRKVELLEESKGDGLLGMDMLINGKKIFLKGSNWVPPECFSGTMKDEKYVKLIRLAKKMNLNILRVWGGGAYEKDIFFELCDKEGILVWQDICFACADIPDDHPDFVSNVVEEVTYQVKRLRNHPSLVYWCGGNEKTGCYGNLISHGDFLVNCILYGVVYSLDDTRPYRRQSPHSYNDIGNDWHSGDSHHNCLEPALERGMKDYRAQNAEKLVPFISECAALGPSSYETLHKIFGDEHMWPMDEMWNDRFMENPYAAVCLDFPHRELFYATELYGKPSGVKDFIKKAMLAHAEALTTEAEYSRAHRDVCGAFLNWMFNDIWPSGTWALLDYYLEPKEAYYALSRSYAPRLVSFYQDKEGATHLFVDNSTSEEDEATIVYGAKRIDGAALFEKEMKAKLSPSKLCDLTLPKLDLGLDVYLYAYSKDGKYKKTLYSPFNWRGAEFENKFDYRLEIEDDRHAKLIVSAKSFVKSLFIRFPENCGYVYSDNYLNLEAGDEAIVSIESYEPSSFEGLSLSAF